MTRRTTLLAAVLLAAVAGSGGVAAQATSDQAGGEALRRQVEIRFDPLPLRDGIALRPRNQIPGVRSIEITGGTIAVDGAPLSGAELRARIGDAADLVIQLSYLDGTALRELFGPALPPDTTPPVPPAVAPSAPELERRDSTTARRRSDRRQWGADDRVSFGGSLRVGPDDVVDGDVAAIGGSVHIEGMVHGEVVAVAGSVDLGQRAVVDGDVTVVGGSLRRAEGARVAGEIREIGLGSFSNDWVVPERLLRWSSEGFGSTLAFISTITRGAVVSLLAALVVLLARTYVDRVGLEVSAEPVKAGAIGFLAQLLFLPLLVITILVLVVTLVGIPLLALIPFVLLGLAVVGLVGFTAVAQQVGKYVGPRLGWTNPGPYLTTFAGVATILLPVLLARLALMAGGTGVSVLWHGLLFFGFCVEYLVWTVGFGAVALVRFGRAPLSADSSQFPANA